MLRACMIGSLWIAFSSIALGQEANLPRGLGYVFAAPGFAAGEGRPTATLQIGVGGELRLFEGLAVGAELGGVGAIADSSDGLGIFSLNGYYHFSNATRRERLLPFITAGYTGAGTREWGERWFNLGGGVDYWPKNRLGLRVELRDQIDANHSTPLHFAGVRVGLIWH